MMISRFKTSSRDTLIILVAVMFLCTGHGSASYNAVECQGNTTMLIREDGSLWAMGQIEYLSGLDNVAIPIQIVGPVGQGDMSDVAAVSLSATGTSVFVLLKDGTLWSAGANRYGQLGQGDQADKTVFGRVQLLSDGGSHVVAIDENGSLLGWGIGRRGQLGNEIPTTMGLSLSISPMRLVLN